jgi:hypothetical protein
MATKTFGTVTVELDEAGKIVSIKNKGKDIKKSYLNALLKAQETPYWILFGNEVSASNAYTGVQMELDAFQGSIFTWCMRWYSFYSRGIMKTPVQTFDNMKYLLLELNSKAYYDLLD